MARHYVKRISFVQRDKKRFWNLLNILHAQYLQSFSIRCQENRQQIFTFALGVGIDGVEWHLTCVVGHVRQLFFDRRIQKISFEKSFLFLSSVSLLALLSSISYFTRFCLTKYELRETWPTTTVDDDAVVDSKRDFDCIFHQVF